MRVQLHRKPLHRGSRVKQQTKFILLGFIHIAPEEGRMHVVLQRHGEWDTRLPVVLWRLRRLTSSVHKAELFLLEILYLILIFVWVLWFREVFYGAAMVPTEVKKSDPVRRFLENRSTHFLYTMCMTESYDQGMEEVLEVLVNKSDFEKRQLLDIALQWPPEKVCSVISRITSDDLDYFKRRSLEKLTVCISRFSYDQLVEFIIEQRHFRLQGLRVLLSDKKFKSHIRRDDLEAIALAHKDLIEPVEVYLRRHFR